MRHILPLTDTERLLLERLRPHLERLMTLSPAKQAACFRALIDIAECLVILCSPDPEEVSR